MKFKFSRHCSLMPYENIIKKYSINCYNLTSKKHRKDHVIDWLQRYDSYIAEGENGVIVFDRVSLTWFLTEEVMVTSRINDWIEKYPARMKKIYDSLEAI